MLLSSLSVARFAFRAKGFPAFGSTMRNFSTDSSSEVLSEIVNRKKILTLNRPKSLNAVNLTMVRQLYKELMDAVGNNTADLVIVKGAGGKAFCAGGDVLAVTNSFKEGTSFHKDFFKEEYKLNYLLGTLSIPYVALIDTITMGGGCGLSLNARFQVTSEKTLLAMPETALGFFPDVGATYFLSRLKDGLGLFLALTGYRLKGADAYHAGLASHYVESQSIPKVTEALINLPSDKCNADAVNETLNQFIPSSIPKFSLADNLNEISHCFHAKSVEEIIRKLQESGSDFAKKQIEELNKMSPTSLKVTFRQLELGKSLSFAEVFSIETRLTQKFLREPDFYEGCRAILIDKDRNPKWNPSKLEDVSDEKIDWYFAPY